MPTEINADYIRKFVEAGQHAPTPAYEKDGKIFTNDDELNPLDTGAALKNQDQVQSFMITFQDGMLMLSTRHGESDPTLEGATGIVKSIVENSGIQGVTVVSTLIPPTRS